MKLRNKKTGEIGCISSFNAERIVIWGDNNSDKPGDDNYYEYNSLAELNDEWEDYEEPKYDDEWLISCGRDYYIEPVYAGFSKETLKKVDELGLLFKTKEEAEKAVEKLKAWKRLKDKGFRFTDWYRDVCEVSIQAEIHDDGTMGMINDLDLLFGGEE